MRLRYWLIKKLVGKVAVVMNVRIVSPEGADACMITPPALFYCIFARPARPGEHITTITPWHWPRDGTDGAL